MAYPTLCTFAGTERNASTSNRLDCLWVGIRICDMQKLSKYGRYLGFRYKNYEFHNNFSLSVLWTAYCVSERRQRRPGKRVMNVKVGGTFERVFIC